MPNTRLFLIVSLIACGFLIWQQWQLDYAVPPPPAAQGDPSLPSTQPPVDPALPSAGDVPSAAAVPDPVTQQPAARSETDATPAVSAPDAQLITVVTDVLELGISTRGGAVVEARLLNYPVALKLPDTKVQLFSTDPVRLYMAQSGLVSTSHESADHQQVFSAPQTRYEMGPGDDELLIPLSWEADGTRVVKTYRLRRGQYDIAVEQTLSNDSNRNWVGSAYRQLLRTPPPDPGGNSFSNPERYSFLGVGLYSPEEKYEKYDFEDLLDRSVQRDAVNGWVAMVQHYFLAAWVPPANETHRLEALRLGNSQRFVTRTMSPAATVAPGEAGYFSATLFVGPKLQEQLEELADGLVLTVDYGIFTPFSKVLYWLLEKIHALTGNWGWAIVLLTVLVKLAFYKLSEAQYRSTAKLRKLQPRIQQLKERYGDDKQKFNVAMMEIYKKEKVNPLGGCLPILIQIPVFFALYWVLLESVELRQADFILWINDLSSPDPYFILPIINGAAMFMTTKLSPNPAADPIQQRIMLAMPIVFSVMFAFFQAGLVLYWTVNAVLSLAQQWVITKRVEAAG